GLMLSRVDCSQDRRFVRVPTRLRAARVAAMPAAPVWLGHSPTDLRWRKKRQCDLPAASASAEAALERIGREADSPRECRSPAKAIPLLDRTKLHFILRVTRQVQYNKCYIFGEECNSTSIFAKRTGKNPNDFNLASF